MNSVFPRFVCHHQAVLSSAPLRSRRARRRRRNCSYLPAGSLNPSTAGVFYQYDPNGNLLWQQTVGGGSTGFLEHEAATHYYWLPNEHGDILIGFDQGANSYAVYTDHLNAPRLVTKIDNPQNPKALTDTSNDLPQVSYGEPEGISPLAIPVWQWSYSPFGADLANGYEARPTTIANNFKPDLWAWVGLPETGGADPNQVAQETWRIQANLTSPPSLNIRYPGQYYDFEAGLVQNWWRTYEPRIGRYVSADPIGLNGGWNRFGYAYQDGVNRYDKSGQSVLPVVLGVAGAAWLAYTLQDDYYAGKTEACRREINQQYRKKYEEVCSKPASTWKASDWYVLNQFPKEIRASAMGSAGEVIDRSMGAGLGGATGAISGDGISAIGKNFFTSFGAYQVGLNSGCSF